jgi:acyl transferase domain-containing protein
MQDLPENAEIGTADVANADLGCIAIIGMSGRFPGARDIGEFWRNLHDGIEAVAQLSEARLLAAGVDPRDLQNPAYVKAAAILNDIDLFDAAFFGFSPKDAAIMDPQHRLFLECAWHALEHAGWAVEQFPGRIGVYAGSGLNTYLIYNLLANRKLLDETGLFALKQTGNDKDVLTTRVSYQLNLTGPSLAVQTACSTSLVAVHLASQALLSHECDMALAGGVTIEVPHGRGYVHREGEILSRDGHCRPFDADSSGTIFGSGAGLVVLRRLEDARRDGDLIHAIIRGTAINNDGSRKVGFLAPSSAGQAEVIAEALAIAGVEADSISYVEAHGTGTAVGDPIEIEALTQAFRQSTQRRGFCAIGSLKASIGHLDAAAGVAGLIKTTLALSHRQIPLTVNFSRPNPLIDFASGPFRVATELTDWEPCGGVRRAGVTALGIGGTNAHVVMEEAPSREASSPSRSCELLTLSAKTPSALEAMTRQLADYLEDLEDSGAPLSDVTVVGEEACPDPHLGHVGQLGDVAFTTHLGRAVFPFRRAITCGNLREAIVMLRRGDEATVTTQQPAASKTIAGQAGEREPPVVFMFPGQGSQYPGMARELYEQAAEFRATVDYCCEFLRPYLGLNLRDVIFPAVDNGEQAAYGLAQTPDNDGGERAARMSTRTSDSEQAATSELRPTQGANGVAEAANLLTQTRITQPALFVIEYALAQEWMRLGIRPAAMIGHSIGEFTAACIAGVFSLDDTLRIVAERGRLIQSMPGGAMVAVGAQETEIAQLLGSGCAIATVNAAEQCVVAGETSAISDFEARLTQHQLPFKRLPVSHAFHSAMMDPIVGSFTEFIGGFRARPPEIRWVSSTTGDWITETETSEPAYWARQLRNPVRFHQGASTLLKTEGAIFLEVGPGRTLAALIGRHPERRAPIHSLASIPGAHDTGLARAAFVNTLAELWTLGCKIDWRSFHRGERHNRVALPVYPFERQRYWIDPDPRTWIESAPAPDRQVRAQLHDAVTLFNPVWRQVQAQVSVEKPGVNGPWLIFADAAGLGRCAIEMLRSVGERVIVVRAGSSFARAGDDEFLIEGSNREDYTKLIEVLETSRIIPRRILHLWNVANTELLRTSASLGQWETESFWSLLYLAQAMGSEADEVDCRMAVVSNDLYSIDRESAECSERALLAGPCGVMPKELPSLHCIHIDVEIPRELAAENGNGDRALRATARQIISEVSSNWTDSTVAYRRNQRMVRTYEPLTLATRPPITIRDGGVYVITGGLGGIGLALAEAIAQLGRVRLVLISRTALPGRNAWPELIATGGTLADRLRKIESIEQAGAEVMVVCANVTDETGMRAALGKIHERFGAVAGVIHAAGTLADSPILTKTAESAAQVLAPKVRGTQVIERVFAGETLDFMLLCSSVSSIIAPAGQVDYTAANAFLDAFAQTRSRTAAYPVIALQFPRWRDVGMAADHPIPTTMSPADGALTVGSNGGAQSGAAITELTLSMARDWIVGEHRTLDGTGVFPGTAYIGMILAAARKVLPQAAIAIYDLEFKRPLEVPPGVERRVQTALVPDGAGYRFSALIEDADGWSECASARVATEDQDGSARQSIEAIRDRCIERELVFSHRQNRQQERFFNFGPRWGALERIDFGREEALATLELPTQFRSDLDVYPVHPALLDMATGAAMFLIADYEQQDCAYVPMNYGRISVRKPLPARCLSLIRIRPEAAADSTVAIFDVDILDAGGEVLIEIREFMLRQLRGGVNLGSQRNGLVAASGARNDGPVTQSSTLESINSAEGVAVFREVLDGRYAANVIAFPSDFSAFAARTANPSPAVRETRDVPDENVELRDDIERTIAQWWKELLGGDVLTRRAIFFA